MGRGRSTSYARARSVEGLGRQLPAFAVGQGGEATPAGALRLLSGGQTWWDWPAPGHLFAGLPPPLADMAPQGYLGHAFAARHPELGLPPSVTTWSDDHRLVALARRGEDCVGDLIVGEESLARFLDGTALPVGAADYPALARRSAGDAPASSAGGERPKFGALVDGRHVLVKFASPPDSPAARRWQDLLWCEQKALELVAQAGVPAARSRLLDVGGWRFLEVERFDRVGPRGRRRVLTLGAIDDEHFGQRDTWSAAAARLAGAPFSLPPEDARHLRWLDVFGQLIGNTDRHFGNVAFLVGQGVSAALRLAPAYDMLPMVLAPAVEVVVERPFRPAPPVAGTLEVWPEAAAWARRYWQEVGSSQALVAEVRAFARGAAAQLEVLAGRIGMVLAER